MSPRGKNSRKLVCWTFRATGDQGDSSFPPIFFIGSGSAGGLAMGNVGRCFGDGRKGPNFPGRFIKIKLGPRSKGNVSTSKAGAQIGKKNPGLGDCGANFNLVSDFPGISKYRTVVSEGCNTSQSVIWVTEARKAREGEHKKNLRL